MSDPLQELFEDLVTQAGGLSVFSKGQLEVAHGLASALVQLKTASPADQGRLATTVAQLRDLMPKPGDQPKSALATKVIRSERAEAGFFFEVGSGRTRGRRANPLGRARLERVVDPGEVGQLWGFQLEGWGWPAGPSDWVRWDCLMFAAVAG